MYVRQVKNRKLTFRVSGKLWQRSLVMSDMETKTLWSHILGKAMQGPLKGTVLTIIPSAMTNWKSWKAKHPRTTVVMLRRTSRRFQTDVYRNPSQFVMGYVRGDKAIAWGFDVLNRAPVQNLTFAKEDLLVTFDKKSSAPYLFHRVIDGKSLLFRMRNGKLIDRETGSQWDLTTGRAVAGRLRGKQLTPLPGIVSFKRAWQNFHPRSVYLKSP